MYWEGPVSAAVYYSQEEREPLIAMIQQAEEDHHRLTVHLIEDPGVGLSMFNINPTWHGPDFTCNFCFETDQSQIYPKLLLCFDSHLLVNTSRCSRKHLSVISNKQCLCLQIELRPTGTPARLENPDYLGLKTQTLPDHSLKNARWVV